MTYILSISPIIAQSWLVKIASQMESENVLALEDLQRNYF